MDDIVLQCWIIIEVPIILTYRVTSNAYQITIDIDKIKRLIILLLINKKTILKNVYKYYWNVINLMRQYKCKNINE